MILRGLIDPYLLKHYNIYIRQVITGSLVALCLLLLLGTNQRARAHVAGRVRNRLAGLGLEPHLALPWPGRSRVQPQGPEVAVALVELEDNVSRFTLQG
jgi:hypothetical protein